MRVQKIFLASSRVLRRRPGQTRWRDWGPDLLSRPSWSISKWLQTPQTSDRSLWCIPDMTRQSQGAFGFFNCWLIRCTFSLLFQHDYYWHFRKGYSSQTVDIFKAIKIVNNSWIKFNPYLNKNRPFRGTLKTAVDSKKSF